MDYEPKILWGMTSREWKAVLVGVPYSALLIAAAIVLDWSPQLVAIPGLIVDAPLALWCLWRPMGLKPEQWIAYAWRDAAGPRFIFFGGPAHARRGQKKPTIDERRR